MANLKTSKADIKKTKRNTARNKHFNSELKTVQKNAKAAIASGDKEAAGVAVIKAVSRLDSAVSKGIIHRNNADRRKSRLMSSLGTISK